MIFLLYRENKTDYLEVPTAAIGKANALLDNDVKWFSTRSNPSSR